ncbi:MAG: regulatory protein RecX [Clostridia bacterium]|nr:regulatory protein RecX [Clostridia bacterium]
MVTIKEIKRNKKSYTLVVGEEVLKNINIEVALSYALKEGEMSKEKFKEFLKENDRQNAKSYLYNMIARKGRTTKEARDRLYEKGFHKDAVEYAIGVVSSYGYLNDEEYAKNYVSSAIRNKGEYRVKRELQLKCISDENMVDALDLMDSDSEYDSAYTLAKKYLKSKDISDEKVKEKLFRYLVSRGYGYDLVKKVMRTLGAEISENM